MEEELFTEAPKTTLNSNMIMLTCISKFREDYRMLYPNDVKINKQITELLHSIAWKIKNLEDRK